MLALHLTQYLLVSLILFASSVVQGAVGFASGLFGIPLLMLTGISLPDAVAISLVAAAVQNCMPPGNCGARSTFAGRCGRC